MVKIGTPLTPGACRALLLGSGELGKELVIALQRLGVEVTSVDRYAHAPAMQVAHHFRVIDMLDGQALRQVVREVAPHFIIPELEAIATSTLLELEQEGIKVVPTARAVDTTMNRERIRQLASDDLGLSTSAFRFADSMDGCKIAAKEIGYPCVIKPVMSSSGKGQTLVRSAAELEAAWHYSQEAGRSGAGRVIIEGFVDFDYEFTLLTVQHAGGISFCAPIGHEQVDGDYRYSWQPHAVSEEVLAAAKTMASQVVSRLGGFGLYGVEFFVQGNQVWFSELSPRPHDTGMVTLVSQSLSEFDLHARALLGLPIPDIDLLGPSVSAAILAEGVSKSLSYSGLEEVLAVPGTDIRLFGKPEVNGRRRVGVVLTRASDPGIARQRAEEALSRLVIHY